MAEIRPSKLADYLITSIFTGEPRPPLTTETTSLASSQKERPDVDAPSEFERQKRIVNLGMSSPNGKMAVDRLDAELSPGRKSYVSLRCVVQHNIS